MISLKEVTNQVQFKEQFEKVRKDPSFSKSMSLLHKGVALIRGTYNQELFYYRSPGQKERKPRDSESDVDNFFEDYRKKNYPKIASRKKAVFAFINFDAEYGNRNMLIFPKNGSKYFQSFESHDFFKSEAYFAAEAIIKGKEEFYRKAGFYKGNKGPQEVLSDYFENGTTAPEKMKDDFREVIIEHKGYWAFELIMLRKIDIKIPEVHR